MLFTRSALALKSELDANRTKIPPLHQSEIVKHILFMWLALWLKIMISLMNRMDIRGKKDTLSSHLYLGDI